MSSAMSSVMQLQERHVERLERSGPSLQWPFPVPPIPASLSLIRRDEHAFPSVLDMTLPTKPPIW